MDKKNLNREWLLRMAERLMKKKKIVIPAALVFIAAAAFTLGRGGKGPEGKPEDMGRQMNVTAVSAEPPGTGSIELETAVTGTIEPSDVVYLYARAAGDVTSVLVKAGDTVEAGQLLAVIDTKQVESAENAMESARLSYESAQSTLSRQELLYAGGDISEQEYEQYQNQAESSRLAYESAKMSYETQVEYSNITAPVSGVIESCSIEAFDHISANERLCVISGEGAQTLKFKVTERIAGNLTAGDELRVEKDGETYSGSITEVSGMADASTGLFEVKGSINGADSVASGSVVKIYLVSDRAENVMTVPVDAVYFDGGVGNFYLYQDGTVHKQQVEVGIFDSSLAEIQSGLTESDLVISTWSSELYEGSTVKLKNEKTDEQPDRQQTESAGEPLDPMPEP